VFRAGVVANDDRALLVGHHFTTFPFMS